MRYRQHIDRSNLKKAKILIEKIIKLPQQVQNTPSRGGTGCGVNGSLFAHYWNACVQKREGFPPTRRKREGQTLRGVRQAADRNEKYSARPPINYK